MTTLETLHPMLMTFFECRPVAIGGAHNCDNMNDASKVVSSVGMCASYAWDQGVSGFCELGGGQCFVPASTSTNVETEFGKVQSQSCSTQNTMTCYKLDQPQQQRRRSGTAETGFLDEHNAYRLETAAKLVEWDTDLAQVRTNSMSTILMWYLHEDDIHIYIYI